MRVRGLRPRIYLTSLVYFAALFLALPGISPANAESPEDVSAPENVLCAGAKWCAAWTAGMVLTQANLLSVILSGGNEWQIRFSCALQLEIEKEYKDYSDYFSRSLDASPTVGKLREWSEEVDRQCNSKKNRSSTEDSQLTTSTPEKNKLPSERPKKIPNGFGALPINF